MNQELELLVEQVTNAVVDALKLKLTAGDTCPCCGRKKAGRKASPKMLEANRRNQKKAVEAIRAKSAAKK